jgi:hypothetical protein
VSATPITVVHTFTNPDGSAGSGVIGFKLSGRMTNASVTYAPQVPVHSTLNGSGQLSQVLPANNDPATTPAGSFYLVTFYLNGMTGDEIEITVPYNAPGGVVDLGSLLPTQSGL